MVPRTRRVAGLAALLTSLVVVTTACGDSGTAETALAATTQDASPSPPTAARSSQTLWQLLDERGTARQQLPDDDPDVVSIRSLIVRHSDLVDNRSPASISASIQGELTAYTPDFAASLSTEGYPDKVESMYLDNKLSVRLHELAWYPSTISAPRRSAVFETATTFEFTQAARSYLTARGLKLNRPYVERRRVSLTRTPAGWRIASIERQPLERG